MATKDLIVCVLNFLMVLNCNEHRERCVVHEEESSYCCSNDGFVLPLGPSYCRMPAHCMIGSIRYNCYLSFES